MHKTGLVISDSFHRILKVKQGHESSVKDEELLLVLFKLEFPNPALFDYPWKDLVKWSRAAPHWNRLDKLPWKTKQNLLFCTKRNFATIHRLVHVYLDLKLKYAPRYVRRSYFSHNCDKFTSKPLQISFDGWFNLAAQSSPFPFHLSLRLMWLRRIDKQAHGKIL